MPNSALYKALQFSATWDFFIQVFPPSHTFLKTILIKNFRILGPVGPLLLWPRILNSLFIYSFILTASLNDFSEILSTEVVIHLKFIMIDHNF